MNRSEPTMRALSLALLLLVSTACTQRPPATTELETKPETYPFERLPANREATRRLAMQVRLTEGAYTLPQVAAMIERDAGLSVRFDWDGLEHVGLTPASTIEIKAGEVETERLLSMVLLNMVPKPGEEYPTFMLVNGVAVVGTNVSLVQKLPQVDWPQRDKPGPPPTASEQALRALERLVTLKSEGVELHLLFQFARDTSDLKIAVDWEALNKVGVTKETKVDFDLHRQPVDQLLRSALDVGEDIQRFLVGDCACSKFIQPVDDQNKRFARCATKPVDKINC